VDDSSRRGNQQSTGGQPVGDNPLRQQTAAAGPQLPRHGQQFQQAPMSRSFDAIKEDPDMSDSEMLKTRTLDQLRKHLSGHARLRLSISTQDLVGKSHEELVLLLIQLRRSQAKLEEIRIWLHEKLKHRRADEKDYKIQRENSLGQLDESLEQSHRYFMELQKEANELDKQIESTQPLINLLDNIITMGSLYGGDHLLYASQYKKHQLPPGQPTSTKNMVEFSRRHQEEQLAEKQKQSMRQLTDDEISLDERLQQLYRLDRVVQERSFNVTSLQEDKAVLERSMDEVQRSEETARDSYTRERLAQRRQIVEQELSRVRQQLADASKLLEEANTENAKVEQEVIMLRNKVYGISQTASSNNPSHAAAGVGGPSQAVLRMEHELSQVRTMMQGLSSQGNSLSETMRSLKPSPPKPPHTPSASTRGTYFETDLDQSITRDIATYSKSSGNAFPSSGPLPSRTAPPQDHGWVGVPDWSSERPAVQDSRPRLTQNHEYHGSRDNNNNNNNNSNGRIKVSGGTISGGRFPAYRAGAGQYQGLLAGPVQPLSAGPSSRPGDGDPRLANVLRRTGSQEELSQSNRTNVDNTGMRTGYYAGPGLNMSTSRPEMMSRDDDYTMRSINHDQGASELRRAKSMPRVPKDEPDNQQANRPYPAPRKESFHRPNEPSSAVQRLFPQYPGTSATGNIPAGYSPTAAPRYVSSAMLGTASAVAVTTTQPLHSRSGYDSPNEPRRDEQLSNFSRWRNMTVSSSHPSALEAQRMTKQRAFAAGSAPVKTRSVDDLVKAELAKTMEFDDATIDRELQRPQLVNIPDRYDPESTDEEEFLTEEERQMRWEKKEKYKKMLAAHSLQDFTAAELPAHDAPVHRLVDDEMRRREQLLDIKQRLAQEVTQRSKDAAMRRRSNPNLPAEGFTATVTSSPGRFVPAHPMDRSATTELIGYVPLTT
jgi:hypothetical protein